MPGHNSQQFSFLAGLMLVGIGLMVFLFLEMKDDMNRQRRLTNDVRRDMHRIASGKPLPKLPPPNLRQRQQNHRREIENFRTSYVPNTHTTFTSGGTHNRPSQTVVVDLPMAVTGVSSGNILQAVGIMEGMVDSVRDAQTTMHSVVNAASRLASSTGDLIATAVDEVTDSAMQESQSRSENQTSPTIILPAISNPQPAAAFVVQPAQVEELD